MGRKFEDSPFKDQYQSVREFSEMGMNFKAATLIDPKTGLVTTHTFLDGRLARVSFTRPDGEWSEEGAKKLWKAILGEEEIDEERELKDFTAYEGEEGGLMVIGKGKSKTFLSFESPELNKKTKKYISKVVDAKMARQKQDEGVRITFGGKRRNRDADDQSSFVTYNNGTSGRISSGGAIYDMYGQQKGWVNSSGFINYNDGTSGRISSGGAVYNMYGQQTGWAKGRNDDE